MNVFFYLKVYGSEILCTGSLAPQNLILLPEFMVKQATPTFLFRRR